MYGNSNEVELVFGRCDGCDKKVKLDDLVEVYDEENKITWFDGTLKPKLMLYCVDCIGRK